MEELLAKLLEDYVARRQRGERPSADDYRLPAGAAFESFAGLIEAESSFDVALKEEEGDLPRAFGAYTLLRELGRGATGIVYEATRGGQTFALKVLRQGFDESPEALARFRREAEACARIRHEHVVEIHEAGEAEGRPFYAMTFLDGRSLSALARSGALPEPKELARRMAKVADALHAIHKAGVVHRDVKPGNIMADSGGRMVLADFGLAKSAGAATLTRTGEALGTPLFMSPEQLLGDRGLVDGRSDVYGLGATLYELLARRPLFRAVEWPELVRAILDERPAPLHEVAPGVPAELSRVVMKALEKRREDRYADAAAMRDDLLAFAEGRSVAGRPVSEARLHLRRLRGRWRPLVAAVVTLAAASYLFLTWNATLRVTTYPIAEAFLDDESLGRTPLVVKVRPGKHKLLLKSPGFEDYVWEEKLVWGSTATIDNTLRARPDDPSALAMLAERYGLRTVALEAVPRTRGAGDDDWIEPISPRGNVRREDVDALCIDVGVAWDAEGRLEVRRGSEVLYSEDFAPLALSTIKLLPELAAALRPGDEFEWGFYPEQGEPKVVRCTLVAVPPGIERMEQELADQDPAVRGHLRALAFLKEGLFLAALDEARRLLQFDRPDPRVLAVIQQALLGAGLEKTPYAHTWDELVDLAQAQGK
jgi:predicted Ser/Thr protein kinase